MRTTQHRQQRAVAGHARPPAGRGGASVVEAGVDRVARIVDGQHGRQTTRFDLDAGVVSEVDGRQRRPERGRERHSNVGGGGGGRDACVEVGVEVSVEVVVDVDSASVEGGGGGDSAGVSGPRRAGQQHDDQRTETHPAPARCEHG